MWQSHSKFKLSGMLSRVPRKFKDAGAPRLLSFSLSSPPFVAVCIGDNYMLVFGTGSGGGKGGGGKEGGGKEGGGKEGGGGGGKEDVGLTFPEDYGPITGFQWLDGDVVLVSLANGYVTAVDFGSMVRMRAEHGLPEAVKATGTTKVFNEYLTCLAHSPASKRIAAVGDTGFKVIQRSEAGGELEVLVDHQLEYQLSVGHCIETCRWDPSGNSLLVTSTDGFLWCFDFSVR